MILEIFWEDVGPFWAHVELKTRLGSSLRALLRLEVDFPGSTPPILEDVGGLLGRFLEIFFHLSWV